MMKPWISLFVEHEREDRRTKIGDPLVGLTKHVDFEALAAGIDAAAPSPSRAKGALRQIRFHRFNEQMIMVTHLAETVHDKMVPFADQG